MWSWWSWGSPPTAVPGTPPWSALTRGLPVWLEKPPAATEQEVIDMQAIAVPPAFDQVGFKKMFAPSTAHVRALLARPEFDRMSSYTYRYSVDLPERPGDLMTPDGRRLLDDFVHVAPVLVDLIDLPSAVTSYRDPGGDGLWTARFRITISKLN
jgi:predicted dehydrogenase